MRGQAPRSRRSITSGFAICCRLGGHAQSTSALADSDEVASLLSTRPFLEQALAEADFANVRVEDHDDVQRLVVARAAPRNSGQTVEAIEGIGGAAS